jgi:hypothetical protein
VEQWKVGEGRGEEIKRRILPLPSVGKLIREDL